MTSNGKWRRRGQASGYMINGFTELRLYNAIYDTIRRLQIGTRP